LKIVIKYSLLFGVLFTGLFTANAQKREGQILDEIVAIVGDNYILKSDIDKEFETLEEQSGVTFTEDDRYQILSSLIAKKLLLYQAQIDSVTVAPERVDAEIDRRMLYILSQFPGGEDDFVKYIGKSIEQFKEETRAKLQQEMVIQEMQQTIVRDIKITPTEVKRYFKKLPKDSLEPVNAEVVVAQIVRYPKITQAEKDYARKKIEKIRKDLLEGADWCITASLESDDPGSSAKCGETGFFGRGQMVPEFEAMAFKLKPDTISKIIETQFGFHILKLIERRGEKVNVRHILVRPKTVAYDLVLARTEIDTLLKSIKANRWTFEEAAKRYSEDERTSPNGGKFTDQLGNTKIVIDQLPKDVFTAVSKMKKGDYLGPEYNRSQDGKDSYKAYHLIDITEPHLPNLEQDWVRIQNAALEKKKAEALDKWIMKHKEKFYIKIIDKYARHPALLQWTSK
jgi:peptidyl-prolyl cis-trans isomerase SurA